MLVKQIRWLRRLMPIYPELIVNLKYFVARMLSSNEELYMISNKNLIPVALWVFVSAAVLNGAYTLNSE